jgi:hypothetical protein
VSGANPRRDGVGAAGVAIVFGLLAAACGSSGSKGAAPTTAANAVNDRAAAQRIVLLPRDVPAGWTGSKNTEDAADQADDAKLAACVGASSDADQTAEVDGEEFEKGDAGVSSQVVFVKTRGRFVQDVAAFRSHTFETCLRRLMEPSLKDSIERGSDDRLGPLSLNRFAPPQHGALSEGFRMRIPVTSPGEGSVVISIDIVVYGAGRAEMKLVFSNVNAPFDPALERTLSDTAAAKLASAT